MLNYRSASTISPAALVAAMKPKWSDEQDEPSRRDRRSGRSIFPPKPRLNLDPHTAVARSRRWGGPDGIPYDYRHHFTPKRAAVVNYIAKYQKRDGKCTAANETIARKVGVSIRTVQRAKRDLKQFAVEVPRRIN